MADRPGSAVRAPARRWLLVLVGGLVVMGGLLAAFTWWRSEVEPPEPGAFYQPPVPLPDSLAGHLVRSEALDLDRPDGASASRVLYLSSDPDGRPIAVSGIVIVPPGDAPTDGRPVLAWAHPTTGVASRCAPSLLDTVASTIPGLDSFLEAGYVVVATDYPGLGTPGPHPYLVGPSEARAVIDSVRAARNLPDAGAGDRFAVWGHSQGGHASIWSAMIAARYASDLELVGSASAAPATDLAALFEADEGELAGDLLASYALVAWSEVFPEARLDDIVKPVARSEVEGIAEGCIETKDEEYVLAPDVLALQIGFLNSDPVTTEPWKRLMRENSTGTDVGVPLFVAQGTADRIVHPDVTRRVVGEICAAGSPVDFRSYEGVNHHDIGFTSAPEAVAWIADRFDGEEASSTCDRVSGDS